MRKLRLKVKLSAQCYTTEEKVEAEFKPKQLKFWPPNWSSPLFHFLREHVANVKLLGLLCFPCREYSHSWWVSVLFSIHWCSKYLPHPGDTMLWLYKCYIWNTYWVGIISFILLRSCYPLSLIFSPQEINSSVRISTQVLNGSEAYSLSCSPQWL